MFNNHQTAASPAARGIASRLLSGGFAALSLIVLLASSNAQAATPAVNSVISNQATANYLDSGLTPQVATSNQVTTVVQQVGSYTLTSDNTKIAAAGTTVYMPHSLINTGNGSDTFNITLPTTFDTTNLSSVLIYADTNSDGVPDGTPLCTVGGATPCTGTNVTTPLLASGAKYDFIVALVVKATAADAAVVSAEVVTAKPSSTGLLASDSAAYPGVTGDTATTNGATYGAAHEKINTDKLTVSNSTPVFSVTKEIVGQSTGHIGDVVTYKLKYTNSGNAAGPVYIKDVIGTAGSSTASYLYQAGTALWSDSATALTDTTGATDDPTGIDYGISQTGASSAQVTTLYALVANVAPNQSGYITFQVKVDVGAPLGSSETTNIASYKVATCSAVAAIISGACTPTSLTSTNPSPFTVVGKYSVIAKDTSATATNTNDGTITGDNLVAVTSAAPGAVITFDNYIWNTGDTADTFNLTINSVVPSTNNFPLGTTFKLFQSDGTTPLLSTDTDGIPDTGAIAVAGSYKVVVKATLPANACDVIDCTSATLNKDFTVEITATSKGDATKSNKVYDQLGTITPPGVDLTNGAVVGTGTQANTGTGVKTLATATASTTTSVNPGDTAQFNLSVKNTGSATDNYDFSYHLIKGTTTPATFVPGTLPAGWSVTIHSGVCGTSLGSVVSNTGAIAAAATANFCAAVVTPLAGATSLAGTYNAYFQVGSNATITSDIKLDQIVLVDKSLLTLTPNGTGQIQPGGTILYPHTLLNGGNTSCNGGFTFDVTNNGAATGWSYVLYYDVNGDGIVDPTDPVIGGGTASQTNLASTIPLLNPSASGTSPSEAKLLLKVQAPSGSSSGALDVINITAKDNHTAGSTDCGTTAPVTDTTTVLAGQIRLDKTQALGAWDTTNSVCVAPTGTYSGSATVLQQKPGQCIWYRVVATNQGDAAVTNVKINDATPPFTSYKNGGNCTTNLGAPTPATAFAPTGAGITGGVGSINCDKWTTIPAAAEVQLDFAVRIDP